MAQLTFYTLLALLVSVLSTQNSEKDVEKEGDMEVSENRIVFQNVLGGFILPSEFGYQSADPLQASGSNSQPTQQYAQQPVQQFLKPQGIPQVYQQPTLNLPISYFNLAGPLQQNPNMQPNSNLYGNSIIPNLNFNSGSNVGYTNNPGYSHVPCINITLLSNVEKLLQKIEPELAELNKTRTVKRK